jgi:hypothetical protein
VLFCLEIISVFSVLIHVHYLNKLLFTKSNREEDFMKARNFLNWFNGCIGAVLAVTLFTFDSIAQVDTAWTFRTAGTQIYGGGITGDFSGDVYVTGHQNDNYLVFKLNPSGTFQWSKIYNGPANFLDIPQAITLDSEGNVVLTGYSYETIVNDVDYFTIKYSPSGDSLWGKRHNGYTPSPPSPPVDFPTSIIADDSGNVYVTGYSPGPASPVDAYTVKYALNGDSLWGQYYNFAATNGGDRGWAITRDLDGNIIVAGESWGGTQIPPATGNDYLVLKYSSSGSFLWVRRQETQIGNADDVAYAVDTDSTGDIYVTGSAQAGAYYISTMRISSSGDTVIWKSDYGNLTPNVYTSGIRIALDDSGNVYVGGRTGDPNFLLLKYNSSGVLLWAKEYGSTGTSDQLFDMKLDQEGNVYLTGASQGDMVAIKYNSSGTEQWVYNYDYNNFNDKIPIAMHVYGPGEVVVTGYAFLTGEIFVVRLSENPTGVIENDSREVADEFYLYQNFPNPFNPVTTIKFSITASPNPSKGGAFVKLAVFNLLGEEITVLVNQILEAGVYTINFNAGKLNSALYIYRLEADGLVQAKKMQLVK